MKKNLKIGIPIAILSVFLPSLFGMPAKAEVDLSKPRGEIRVVESWRPDINVLGHNVLQYLFEYALDRNELAPYLAVSREWIDGTTRRGIGGHCGQARLYPAASSPPRVSPPVVWVSPLGPWGPGTKSG